MKTALEIIIGLGIIAYAAGIEITLKPFSIKFTSISTAFAYLFLVLAILCFQFSAYKRGNLAGYKEALDDVRKEFANVKTEDKK